MLFLLFSLGTYDFNATANHMEIDRELIEVLVNRNKIIETLSINTEEEVTGAYLHWDSIPIHSPMKFSDIDRLSSDFGMRKHPILKIRMMHTGVDLSGKHGSDIFSTACGVVESVNSSYLGYGNNVVIKHSKNYKTRYAHLSEILVKEGESVEVGDIVGTLGSTGLSTGPHLHYEIIKDDKPIDPLFFTYKEQYDRNFESYKNFLTTLEENRNAWYVSQHGNVQAISSLKSQKEYES